MVFGPAVPMTCDCDCDCLGSSPFATSVAYMRHPRDDLCGRASHIGDVSEISLDHEPRNVYTRNYV
jgi:hypothetical protein